MDGLGRLRRAGVDQAEADAILAGGDGDGEAAVDGRHAGAGVVV